ncbi:hypothetical protein ILYODFUR_021358, partial [Ilyodon furcidens]
DRRNSSMGANVEKTETCGTVCLKYLLFSFNFLFWSMVCMQTLRSVQLLGVIGVTHCEYLAGLQEQLQVCSGYGRDFDIKYNSNKSTFMIVEQRGLQADAQ